ncbi:hypothetical protein M407DRAFT_34371 [Tulasnella calospora MUT 4182]|uniref:Uncharacterized protein n=1 Tax=Tulasnella calospora MUT 4182 TaxID=1051891 RepID=A0A0C3Q0S1_9AGAM|nr:hypothetical protein M407DRAFT_34371 [Tulasnella calospora MUT 4182]
MHQRAAARIDEANSERNIGSVLQSVVQGVQHRAASRLRQYLPDERLNAISRFDSPLGNDATLTVEDDVPVYESLREVLGDHPERFTLDLPSTQAEILSIATGLSRVLEGEVHLDDDTDEGECEMSDDEAAHPSQDNPSHPEQTSRANGNRWFPWPDKISCTLDILMHLPRSAFSERQLDLLLWLLRMNGADNLPSVRAMKSFQASLQKLCGIGTIKYAGELGHTYYANDIGNIIGQEMSNPIVRKDLHFYPEEVGT